MSTDRELLELAAKAAAIEHDGYHACIPVDVRHPRDGDSGLRLKTYEPWNPLTDDGDALRLAVRLRLNVYHDSNLADVHGTVNGRDVYATEAYLDDPYAASRRAIVRAAAEIGRAKGD
jgi:hypothetical protein